MPALPFGALAGTCWTRWTPAIQRSAVAGVRGSVRVMDRVPDPDMLTGCWWRALHAPIARARPTANYSAS